MIFWNGVQSTTSIVVVVIPDSDGVCTLTAGGQTDSATSASGTYGGAVRLEVTGLSPDVRYDYTVTSPDGSDTGSCRTFPTSGPIKILNFSCQGNLDFPMARVMAKYDAHICICNGDESYREDDFFDTVTNLLDPAQHYAFHREARSQFLKEKLITHVMGFGYVCDDHDHIYNNGVDDLATVQAQGSGERDASYLTMTQEQWDTAKDVAADRLRAYSLGNPPNNDADAETGAFYFRFEAGDCEVFVGSQVVSSETRMRGVVGNNSMNGDDQNTWLINQLAASTKPTKLIIMPKAVLGNQAVNNDSWREYNDCYTTLESIEAGGSTGRLWMGGDWHSCGIYASEAGIAEGTQGSSQGLLDWNNVKGYDFTCVYLNNCSSGRFGDVRDSDPDDLGNNDVTRFTCTDDNGREDRDDMIVFGLAEVSAEKITGKMINHKNAVVASATVTAGENKLTVPDIKLSA